MSTTPSGWPDAALRSTADVKLRHAFELQRELYRRVLDDWWRKGPATLERIQVDDYTVEYVVVTEPLPATIDWGNRATDILQNLRSALDRVHFAVTKRLAPSEADPRTYFPITSDHNEWKSWLGRNRGLPRALTSEYMRVQPWMTDRPFLRDMNRICNLEKHSVGVGAGLAMSAMRSSGHMVVEGIDGAQAEASHVGPVDVVTGRDVMAWARYSAKILELGELDSTTVLRFEPRLMFDDQQIPLLSTVDACAREVAWAVGVAVGSRAAGPLPPHPNTTSQL